MLTRVSLKRSEICISLFGGFVAATLRGARDLKLDNQGHTSLQVGKNKILSLEAVNKTPIIRRKLNTMKRSRDKGPPSVNERRAWLIKTSTGSYSFYRNGSDESLTTAKAAKNVSSICQPPVFDNMIFFCFLFELKYWFYHRSSNTSINQCFARLLNYSVQYAKILKASHSNFQKEQTAYVSLVA